MMEAFGQQRYKLHLLTMLCYVSTHYTSYDVHEDCTDDLKLQTGESNIMDSNTEF